MIWKAIRTSQAGTGFSTDEVVMETYEPVSKTDDFTPYRGENPDNYIIDTCNPGSYKIKKYEKHEFY